MRTLLCILWFTALAVLAQAEVGVVEDSTLSSTSTINDNLPATKSEFWTYAIAFIVPLIVGGFKKLIPAIPKWALPVSTPFVGLLLGAGLKALGAADMSWVDMAQAGAMAVMIRESFNKLVTTPMLGEKEAKTKDPEDVAKEKGKQ